MRAIQYAAPQSLEEAISLLLQIGPKARILAGGTDLIVQVGTDARDVDVIVDGKHIPELMELAFDTERRHRFAPCMTRSQSVPRCRLTGLTSAWDKVF